MATFSKHSWSGSVELSDGTVFPLDIKGGSAALEEARSPFGQLNVTTPLPEASVLEKINPYANLRGQFTLRQDFGQGGYARDFSAKLPPVPRSYGWEGTPNASSSVLKVDGVVTRRNQCTNPGFEVSTAGWTPVSGSANLSVSTVWKDRGTRSGLVAPAAANTNSYIYAGGASSFAFGMQPGKTYALGSTLYVPVAQTGTLSTNARKMWVQITTPTGTTNQFSAAGAAVGTTVFGMSVTVPADALGVFVILMNGATNSAANLTYWDSVYVIEGSGQQSYFDGSMPSTPIYKKASDVTAIYGGKKVRAVSADYFTPWNTFGPRSPTKTSFNVLLRSRDADPASGELELVFNTDEMLLQDYALVSRFSEAPTTATVKGAVNLALSKIGASLSGDSIDATVTDIDSLVWAPGQEAWDFVAPLVQAADLRLYCDQERVWRLVRPQQAVDGFLSLSASNNVKRGRDVMSLDSRSDDSWYDAYVVIYTWRDAAGVDHTEHDIAGDPASARKVRTIKHDDTVFPGPGAANALLKRAAGRGRVLTVEAVSDYSTTPGLPLGISLPNANTQTGFVSAVDWDFPDNTMTVKSRGLVDTPPDSWALVNPDLTWDTVPDDNLWSNYPYTPIGTP